MCWNKSLIFHYNELDYTDRIQYVLKTSEIFPYDLEISERCTQVPLPKTIQNTLRPEFTCNYEEFLLADTLKGYQNIKVGFDW